MKKYALGLCSIALAIGFSAFTTGSYNFYVYTPSTVNMIDIIDVNSYSLSIVLCNGSSGVPCKINIEGFPGPISYVAHLNSLVDDEARFADFYSRATTGEKP